MAQKVCLILGAAEREQLAAIAAARKHLKVRSRFGCSLCACQMCCTEPSEMPMALAIARPVQ
jgi:hypothetical protein